MGGASGATNPGLYNPLTGMSLRYTGTLPSGTELLVYQDGRLTATRNGAGVLGSMSDDFFNGWALDPGQTATITAQIDAGSVLLQMSFRSIYLY